MNNKGQTLIIFVILIPIIILILALVVDVSYMNIEKSKYQGIIEEAIKECLEKKDVSLFHKTLEINDISTTDYEVSYQGDVEVLFTKSIPSIFGKIIAIENYEVKIHLLGTSEKGEIIIKRIEKGRLT